MRPTCARLRSSAEEAPDYSFDRQLKGIHSLAARLQDMRSRAGQTTIMNSTDSLPFLRVPPFPASEPAILARREPQQRKLSNAEIDQLIERLAEIKVGGAYWAPQPPLPHEPYSLIRLADPRARAEALSSASAPALVWSEVDPADPWHLVSGASELIIDADDELALIAAIAGVPVRGQDLSTSAMRELFFDRAVRDLAYVNPFTGEAMSVAEAIELCGFWRRTIDANRDITAAVGFAFWKRETVAPLLWGGASDVPFVTKLPPVTPDDHVAVWKSRTASAALAKLQASGASLIEVEDGFIRSAGLGADCVPPLSIVVDRLGVHFNPQRPSELEKLLQDGEFGRDTLDRARQLRELIVERGLSKYSAGGTPLPRRVEGRRHILVPGQVEDDRSVLEGGGAVTTNLELLRRVRNRAPDAYILYKPHPDIVAGHRVGAIPDELSLTVADEVIYDAPISSLIAMVDEVHVNTSLAGFEALIRGKPVTTHGVPFYAGWGLTTDLGAVPSRRSMRRSVDELVAAVLLLYPRYLDPVTGLPCPAEIVVARLSAGDAPEPSLLVTMRRVQGKIMRQFRSLVQ